jgi:16S rRNA (cytosine1402-N4)-methyltransferase
MRMNRDNSLTASEIVNKYSEEELVRILRDYGEEKCAGRIAANIVKARAEKPLETTGELSEIVYRSIPMKMRREGGNPCKRTFQAIRIACNRELEVLSGSLDSMIGLLKDEGRLCIITFHSLEDRIVKTSFSTAENPCTCPPDFPVCVCGKKSLGKVITRKPVIPSEDEINSNPRARSSKLRVFEVL